MEGFRDAQSIPSVLVMRTPMASYDQRFLAAALLVLMVTSSLTEASNWLAQSSDLTTPPWRRLTNSESESPAQREELPLITKEIESSRRSFTGEGENLSYFETVLIMYVLFACLDDNPPHSF